MPRLPGFQLALVLLNRPASAEETLREMLAVLTTLLALSASVRGSRARRVRPVRSGPGGGDHTAVGIMRKQWHGAELRRMHARNVRFTPAQAEQIRRRLWFVVGGLVP